MDRSSVPRAADPGGGLPSPGEGPAARAELAELRARLREAEETIEAIRSGGVDSLMIGSPGQERVYALASADRPYRLIVEAMNEGAATISPRGVILDANPRLCSMTGRSAADLVGAAAIDLFPAASQAEVAGLLDVGAADGARGAAALIGPGDRTVPVVLAVSGFDLDGMLLRSLVLTDVTAQYAAEKQAASTHRALREQDAFLEQAQESLGLGWWTSDLDQADRLTLSSAAYRICGLTPAQSDGTAKTFWRLVHPDDVPRISRALAAALDGGAPFHVEHRIVRPDGTLRWVLQAAVIERDEGGRPCQLLGICQDITERKRIEDEIRAVAAYNRNLLNASLDPMFTIGTDGAITDINTATERETGYERDELLGTDFSGYFTEPDVARAGYEQAFREGTVRDYGLELRHRDGQSTSVLYNASVYRDHAGRVLGVLAAARDVTQLKSAQEAMRESEARLRALFDNAPVGIDELGLYGEIGRVNERLCQITGYSAEELRARNIQDIIHPDDRDADLAGLERLRSGELNSLSAQKRYVRKDGGVVWAEVNRAVVRTPDGSPQLLVSAIRDITAQREAEAEVRALNAGLEAHVGQRTAELERANSNLEAFTYSVSHDLRAPLRALSGFSEALLEEYGDRLEETGRGYAGRIQAASERMAELIDDLLQLSRVSRAELNLGPVDLSADVSAIAGELRSREPDRQVDFAIEDGVWVTADGALIRSVVQNLVENAWKFTSHRDRAIIEFATTTADNGGVCCYVRDNGAGFDPAFGGKLFQPFQRLHTDAEFPGTGIGLASVRRIIERHGGRAWAEGAVGQGASVYFTLDGAAPPDSR